MDVDVVRLPPVPSASRSSTRSIESHINPQATPEYIRPSETQRLVTRTLRVYLFDSILAFVTHNCHPRVLFTVAVTPPTADCPFVASYSLH